MRPASSEHGRQRRWWSAEHNRPLTRRQFSGDRERAEGGDRERRDSRVWENWRGAFTGNLTRREASELKKIIIFLFFNNRIGVF